VNINFLQVAACRHLNATTPSSQGHATRVGFDGRVRIPLDPRFDSITTNLQLRICAQELGKLLPQSVRKPGRVLIRENALQAKAQGVEETTSIWRLPHNRSAFL
jgi:hypothetical protein